MTRGKTRAFTLIELLVVLAVLAVLVSMVAPSYLEHVSTAREATLRHNLQGLRTTIDQFYRDKGRYPVTLEELVAQRYIRTVPVDPITQRSDSWVLVPPRQGDSAIFDVKSGAAGRGSDGVDYAAW